MLFRFWITFLFVASSVLAASVLIDETDATPGFSKQYKLNGINEEGKMFGITETITFNDQFEFQSKFSFSEPFDNNSSSLSSDPIIEIGPYDIAGITLHGKDKVNVEKTIAFVSIKMNMGGKPSSSLTQEKLEKQINGDLPSISNKKNNNDTSSFSKDKKEDSKQSYDTTLTTVYRTAEPTATPDIQYQTFPDNSKSKANFVPASSVSPLRSDGSSGINTYFTLTTVVGFVQVLYLTLL